MDSFERDMLAIDIEAIQKELDPRPIPVHKSKVVQAPRIKTAAESTRCKWTKKVQFDTAPEAIEALRRWKMKDRDMCWDLGRMRIYKCKKCHKMHLGKDHGLVS